MEHLMTEEFCAIHDFNFFAAKERERKKDLLRIHSYMN